MIFDSRTFFLTNLKVMTTNIPQQAVTMTSYYPVWNILRVKQFSQTVGISSIGRNYRKITGSVLNNDFPPNMLLNSVKIWRSNNSQVTTHWFCSDDSLLMLFLIILFVFVITDVIRKSFVEFTFSMFGGVNK